MLELRASGDRGHADHGWLESRHCFSFAEYYDPRHLGFGPLRVINEDRVVPGAGFGAHGHRDMEILSYVLAGALEHRDSLGNGSILRPGDVQRMSAGTGVTHSEFNASHEAPVHFLQIWIEPARRGLTPGYEERHFADADKRGRLCLLAAPDGSAGSLRIHQDVRVHAGLFDADERARLPLHDGRRAYIHLARGTLSVNGVALTAGDALKLAGCREVELCDGHAAEVLVFDLPPAQS